MSRKNKRRGIVLLVSLVVASVSMMFLGAGLTLSQMDQSLAGNDEDLQSAQESAKAGLAYARTRLQEDPNWRGTGLGGVAGVTVDMPGLWVREDQGNVVGILGQGTDKVSCFRIRFNYQNGNSTSPDDFLPDPSATMRFPGGIISENNLNANQLKVVHRAQTASPWRVPAGSTGVQDISRYSALVVVEGLAGDGMRDLASTNLSPAASNRRVSRRYIEALFTRDMSKFGDAALNGGADVTGDLNGTTDAGTWKIESRDGGVVPRARSNRDITLQNNSAVDKGATGILNVKNGSGRYLKAGVDQTAQAVQEDSTNRIPKVGWDQIPKATAAGPRIAGGTYVWRANGPLGVNRSLEYYPQTYTAATLPATPGVPVSAATMDGGSAAVELVPDRMLVRFRKDVFVTPSSSGETGLNIIAAPGLIAAIRNRPNVRFTAAAGDPPPILTANGNIFLEGDLKGKGSVTSEGNITFQGTSVFDADPDQPTSVYAKGDINLMAIPPQVFSQASTPIDPITGAGGHGFGHGHGHGSGHGSGSLLAAIPTFLGGANPFTQALTEQDVAFAGLMYAQGKIHADFSAAASQRVSLFFKGMVVSYGGNPDTQTPGASGGGTFEVIHGKNMHMVYDSTLIRHTLGETGSAKLTLQSWQTY